MKTEEIIIAGFGGQGVLSLGMTLAYAGMVAGKEISWMPSYGPEMRGGTANCMVILSDNRISSPILSQFDTAIILNQPSMEKFAHRVKPGGLLLYEKGNVLTPSSRTDIEMVGIDAATEAMLMGQPKVMNMILLGAYLHIRPVVATEAILAALPKVLPEKYHTLLGINAAALQRGASLLAEKIPEPV